MKRARENAEKHWNKWLVCNLLLHLTALTGYGTLSMERGGTMIECFLVSHGGLAKEIATTVEMLSGQSAHLQTFGLAAEESVDHFKQQLEEALAKVESDVLIFADLFGGSPMLSAASLIRNSKYRIGILSGMNLPMIIELLFRSEQLNLDQALDLAENMGKEGIKKIVKEDFNVGSTSKSG